MKYVYILLICLIIFYILSRYFEKYYSQENFDPSLVPVSSIITLAKVAQKIVDGNGTLTNPANLNIGTTSAKGNLLVTGNSTTNGNKQIDGTLGVTGPTTLSNTLGIIGNTTVGGTLGVTGPTTLTGGITGGLNVTGVTTLGTSTPGATSLTVNGATKITGDTTIKALTISGASVDPIFKFGDNTGHNLSFYSRNYDYSKYPPTLTNDSVNIGTRISDNGDITAGRHLYATGGIAANGNVSGAQLCIGDTCLTQTDLKRLKGQHPFNLYYNKNDPTSVESSGNRTYVSAFNTIGNDVFMTASDSHGISSFYIK